MHGIKRYRVIYSVAITVSLLLSYWAYLRTYIINPDGICYTQSALALSKGLPYAMHLCDEAAWPLYSMLIYGVVSITHLPAEASAFLLDGIFSLISVTAFITIVRYFTSSRLIVAIAAVVILLAHEFNAVRTEIIRDHGYWACYLLSLFFLLLYFKDKRWSYALLWSAALIIATLFRVEGAVFLMAVPLVALVETGQSLGARLMAFLQLNSVALIAGLIAFGWVLLHPTAHLGRLSEVSYQLTHGIYAAIQHFQATAMVLGQHVLSIYSARDASLVLFLMLVSWYGVSVAINVSLIYAVFIGYAWYKIKLKDQKVLWAYVLVNVLVTGLFLTQHLFLSKRYLMALSLVLMVWVPFALAEIIKQWQWRKWPAVLAGFFMVFYAIGGIADFGYSKKYLRNAGDWMWANIPENSQVYSNDLHVMYYSKHFGDHVFSSLKQYSDKNNLSHQQWSKFDYFAIRFSKQDKDVFADMHLTKLQEFKNKRGDGVVIYSNSRRMD